MHVWYRTTMPTEKELRDALQSYQSPTEGVRLWRVLGYHMLNNPLPAQEMDELPASARQHIKEAFLLGDVRDTLRLYHLRTHTARRTHLRQIIEPLYRRYPQYEFLFVVQPEDTSERTLLFVHPRPILKDTTGRITTVIRTLPIDPNAPTRTDLEILMALATVPDVSPENLRQQVEEAFNVEKVTDRFFEAYSRLFEQAVRQIEGIPDEEARRQFVLKLFNRLMFLRFLERKGWLRFNGRTDYLRALWASHSSAGILPANTNTHGQDARATTAGDFYATRLKPLFFGGLNNPQHRNLMRINQGGLLTDLIGEVPYLNGGLFEADEQDKQENIRVPDALIGTLLSDLFYRYNFTITESTPMEVEVAVDPEMLGKVFEELVTGRHESGSYYTPRPVVAFMCREALKSYLQSATRETPEAIAQFVDGRDSSRLRDPEAVLKALKTVRVCDPACGSGAYLLGMLQELLELRTILFEQKHLDPETLYQRKLEIIQNNLYGVDIDPFAVEIARLRLWLSLVVDDTRHPLDDPDADVSLPNLDFKIEVGDSLTAPDPQGGQQADMFRRQQIEEYENLKAQYLREHSDEQKRQLREQIDALREEIRVWTHADKPVQGFDWRVEFAEVFREGGFDIILANPPYVRQELIPNKDMLLKAYPDAAEGRSDLYVYFYARALQLLKPGGMHVFICSNSWLDVGFGGKLQKYLLENAHILAIYDSALERQFASADVNTIISILRKGRPAENAITRFIRLQGPFESAVADPSQQRVIEKTRAELWQEGLGEEGRYTGNKWGGKYLRAPDIYFTILEKGQRYKVFHWQGTPVIVEDITDMLEE